MLAVVDSGITTVTESFEFKLWSGADIVRVPPDPANDGCREKDSAAVDFWP